MASFVTSSPCALSRGTFFLALVLVHAVVVVTNAASLYDGPFRPLFGATVIYPSLETPPPFIPSPPATRIPFIKPTPDTTTTTTAPPPPQATATTSVGQVPQVTAPLQAVTQQVQTVPQATAVVATPPPQAPAPQIQQPAPTSTAPAVVTTPAEGVLQQHPSAAVARAAPTDGEVEENFRRLQSQPTLQQPALPQRAAVAIAAPEMDSTLQQVATAPTTVIAVTVPTAGDATQSFQPQEPEQQPAATEPAAAAVAVAAPATPEGLQQEAGLSEQPTPEPAVAVAVAAPAAESAAETQTQPPPELKPGVLITLADSVEEGPAQPAPTEPIVESTAAQGSAVAGAAPSATAAEVYSAPVEEAPSLPVPATASVVPAPPAELHEYRYIKFDQTSPPASPPPPAEPEPKLLAAAAVVTVPESLDNAASSLGLSVPQPSGATPSATAAAAVAPTPARAARPMQTPLAIFIRGTPGAAPVVASVPDTASPTARDAANLSAAAPSAASVSAPAAAAAVASPPNQADQPKIPLAHAQSAFPIIASAERMVGPPAVETEKLQEIHVKVSKAEKPERVTAAELTGPLHAKQAAACDGHQVSLKRINAGLGMLYYYNTDAIEEFHSVNLILPDGKNFRAKIDAVVRDPPPSEEQPKPKSIVHLTGGHTLELGLDGVTLKDEDDEEVASWEAEAVLYPIILEEVTIREAAATSAAPVTSVSKTSTSTVVPQEDVQKAVIAVETEAITSSVATGVVAPSPSSAAAAVAEPAIEESSEAPAAATAVAVDGSSKKRRTGTTELRVAPSFGNRARAAPPAVPTYSTAQLASPSSHPPDSTISLAAATEKSFEEQKKLLASRHPAVLDSGEAIKSVRMLAVSRGNVGTVRLSMSGLAAPGMAAFTCVFRTGIYGDYDPCNTPAVIASNYFRPLTSAVVGGF